MKMNRTLLISFAILVVLIGSTMVSCSAGMSKSERLEAFKADILAVDNPREHFKGHPNAPTVDYATVTTINLDNTGGDLEFTGQVITGDSFTLNFTLGVTPYVVTGVFFNAGSGGLAGDDWFIYTITNGVLTIP